MRGGEGGGFKGMMLLTLLSIKIFNASLMYFFIRYSRIFETLFHQAKRNRIVQLLFEYDGIYSLLMSIYTIFNIHFLCCFQQFSKYYFFK